MDRMFKMFHEGNEESSVFMAGLRVNLYTNREELVEKETRGFRLVISEGERLKN